MLWCYLLRAARRSQCFFLSSNVYAYFDFWKNINIYVESPTQASNRPALYWVLCDRKQMEYFSALLTDNIIFLFCGKILYPLLIVRDFVFWRNNKQHFCLSFSFRMGFPLTDYAVTHDIRMDTNSVQSIYVIVDQLSKFRCRTSDGIFHARKPQIGWVGSTTWIRE